MSILVGHMSKTIPLFTTIGLTCFDINKTPTETSIMPGGAVFFASIAASTVLQPVGLVTKVGYDFDTTYLTQKGILAEGISIVSDKPTDTAILKYLDKLDLTQRSIETNFDISMTLEPKDIPKTFLDSRIIHIGTTPPVIQARFLPYLREHSKALISIDSDSIFLDNPDHRDQALANLQNADIVFLNRKEQASVDTQLLSEKELILKLDKEGALVQRRDKTLAETKVNSDLPAKDPTGAGDILAGSYLASRALGKAPQESLDTAVALATRSVTQNGINHLFAT